MMSDITCDECDEAITLTRNDRRELQAHCDCDVRSVRMRKVAPLEWSE